MKQELEEDLEKIGEEMRKAEGGEDDEQRADASGDTRQPDNQVNFLLRLLMNVLGLQDPGVGARQ